MMARDGDTRPEAAAHAIGTPAATRPYPAYRDSVPEHWEVRRVKHSLGVNVAVLPEDTDPDYEFRYIDIGCVGTGELISDPKPLRFATAPSRARRVVGRGDTLVSTVRTYLKAVWHAEEDIRDVVASTGFAVLTPRPWILPKFVGYACRSEPFTNHVTAESVGVVYPAIAEARLASTLRLCIPPFPEQRAIVRFLDHADRRIQRYIRAKEKLIELLEEQKQAIIHQAVTGQIDVRTGQPYPAYKDSGVEWGGEMPHHWDRRAVGQLFHIGRGKVTSHEYIAQHLGPFPLYSSQTENDGIMGYIDTYMFEGDYLTWTTDGAHAGTIFRRSGRFNCTNVCGTLRPKETMDMDYMSMAVAIETKPRVRLDINPKLMNNVMARIRICVPPVAEQRVIARYVRGINEPGRVISQLAHRQIGLYKEYRTRLIADVVTGKLDIRQTAASLPEADPLTADDPTANPATQATAQGSIRGPHHPHP